MISEGRTSFCLVNRKIASSIRTETHSDGFSIGRSPFPRYFESHASIARNPCKGPLEYDQRFENATHVPFVFRAKALFFSFPLLPFIFRPCFLFFYIFFSFSRSVGTDDGWNKIRRSRWDQNSPFVAENRRNNVDVRVVCDEFCVFAFRRHFPAVFPWGTWPIFPICLYLFRNISDRTAFQHFYAIVYSFCFFAISNRTVHRNRYCDLRKRMVPRPKKGSSYERQSLTRHTN